MTRLRMVLLPLSAGLLLACSASGPTTSEAGRSGAQATAKCDLARLSPAEKERLDQLKAIAYVAMYCKSGRENTVTFDWIYEGCTEKTEKTAQVGHVSETSTMGTPLKSRLKTDPRKDAEFEFQFEDRPRTAGSDAGNTMSIAMTPRQPGKAGFFSDGFNFYCNPQGRATAQRELAIGNLRSFGLME